VHRNHATILLLFVLAGHLLFGLARIPHAVFGKRAAAAADHELSGRVRYILDTRHVQGWAEVEWLLRNTPADSVILWRGEAKGSFELVADLVFPRLLYEAWRVAPGIQTIHGRPVASRILVGLGTDLELVPR
jgi:hypothetical protein